MNILSKFFSPFTGQRRELLIFLLFGARAEKMARLWNVREVAMSHVGT